MWGNQSREDLERAIVHLSIGLGAVLFMLFLMAEDIERLKRITRPHMVFVAPRQNSAPEPLGAGADTLEGDFDVLN